MLIKSNAPRVEAPVAQLSMEDIDHVIHAYELQGVVTSIESLHQEIVHANDIADATEQLALVLESIQELSMTDAALVQVVGDIAGASCGVDGSAFTPSMEDVEEGVPMGQKIKAILNQIAAFIRKILAQIKMYIGHQFSRAHRIAKKYESMGEMIRNFDFNQAIEFEMADIAGVKGGLVALAKALPLFHESMTRCFRNGAEIFEGQVQTIEAVQSTGLQSYPAMFQKVHAVTEHAAMGYTKIENHIGSFAVSARLIGGGEVQVSLVSQHNANPGAESYKHLFDAKIGVVRISENGAPIEGAFNSGGKVKMKINHVLMKTLFDEMRETIELLTSPSRTDAFLTTLKQIDAKGMELDQWLHSQTKLPAEAQTHAEDILQFYRVAATQIAHGQLKAVIHTHHYFQNQVVAMLNYMERCLKMASPHGTEVEGSMSYTKPNGETVSRSGSTVVGSGV